MEQGYVIFREPCILHTGLNRYKNRFSSSRFTRLTNNGFHLEEEFFGTDMPNELENKKLYFTEKYADEDKINTGYLVNVKGYPVMIEDIENAEEIESYELPSHLFEL